MNAVSIRKGFLLFLIFIIFCITSLTLFLTLFYVDPYTHTYLATPVLIFACIASFTTFLTLVIYFFKKIYFRWEVYIYHVITSFRQGFLISLFCIWIGFFVSYRALNFSTAFLFGVMLLLMELFVQNFHKKY